MALSAETMDYFNETFGKYRNMVDKFESLFIFILRDIPVSDFVEKVSHQLKLINTTKDNVKRKYLNDRMYEFKTYITDKKHDDGFLLNKIYMISSEIDEIDLAKPWLKLLREFEVDQYIFQRGSSFDIDYLKDLLLNDKFKHIIHLRNTALTHIHLGFHKKRTYHYEDSKNTDIVNYVTSNINERCLIHGSSVILKTLKIGNHIIFNRHLRDEEIFDEFKKMEMFNLHQELQEIFNHIQNPKMIHRIVFGKDIGTKILSQELKVLYCTPPIKQKIDEKIDKGLINFEIKVVTPLEKGDVVDTLKRDYDGSIGMTYY
jgi:hypothetical protein